MIEIDESDSAGNKSTHIEIDKDFAFYVVMNSEGKFFRRKGYGGGGESWVESLNTARIWANLSGARAVVTFFSKNP